MRQHQLIPRSSPVHHQARQLMSHFLPWQNYRESLTIREIFDLLLLMTTTCRTLSHIVRCFFTISDETARRAILSQLPDQPALTCGLVDALHHAAAFSRCDRKRLWTVAIDENKMPYYGQLATPGIQGGQKKQGTSYFYTYATAALIHQRRRSVVGLIAVTESMKPHPIVAALLEQIDGRDLRVGGWSSTVASTAGKPCCCCKAGGSPTRCPCDVRAAASTPATRCSTAPRGRSSRMRGRRGARRSRWRLRCWSGTTGPPNG